jgi:hypothetical protein
VWAKLNPNERLVGYGSIAIVVGYLVLLVGSFGYGGGLLTLALLGAIAALAVLYLKYSPTQQIAWPAPIPVVLLAISAVVGIVELLALLSVLSVIAGFFGLWTVGVIITIIGGALMVWGAYQEWNATRTTA